MTNKNDLTLSEGLRKSERVDLVVLHGESKDLNMKDITAEQQVSLAKASGVTAILERCETGHDVAWAMAKLQTKTNYPIPDKEEVLGDLASLIDKSEWNEYMHKPISKWMFFMATLHLRYRTMGKKGSESLDKALLRLSAVQHYLLQKTFRESMYDFYSTVREQSPEVLEDGYLDTLINRVTDVVHTPPLTILGNATRLSSRRNPPENSMFNYYLEHATSDSFHTAYAQMAPTQDQRYRMLSLAMAGKTPVGDYVNKNDIEQFYSLT